MTKLDWCGIWYDPDTGRATVRAHITTDTAFGPAGFDVTADPKRNAAVLAKARELAALVAGSVEADARDKGAPVTVDVAPPAPAA